jgi:hypothetical protein
VTIVAVGYLGAMFLNVVYPSGLSSGRAILNLDWITLFIMFIISCRSRVSADRPARP